MFIIEVDGVSVECIKKSIRRMNLHATHTRVWMSIPMRATQKQARAFITAQLAWIRTHQTAAHATTLAQTKTVAVWGCAVPLCIRDGAPDVALVDGVLVLTTPQAYDESARAAVLNTWYRKILAARLPAVRAQWEERIGQQAHECRIRQMKTRWGTCNVRARRIWISLQLASCPIEWLNYVMAHELTHLLVPNHSAEFWSLMDEFYPNWRAIRAEMRSGAH